MQADHGAPARLLYSLALLWQISGVEAAAAVRAGGRRRSGERLDEYGADGRQARLRWP
jgi:hypothetical protein